MSAFTPASEVLLRHMMISNKAVFFLPETYRMTCPAFRYRGQPCSYPAIPPLAGVSRQMGDNARFSLVATANDVEIAIR